jgi:uncharacterized protein DUF6647
MPSVRVGSAAAAEPSQQDRGRYGNSERLGRFEIDHQFEPRRMLDRPVTWIGVLSMEETMFKQLVLFATLVTLGMAVPSVAQTVEKPIDLPMPPSIESLPEQPAEVPGIKYELFGSADFRQGAARPTQTLLTEIVTWLSVNFGLPAIYDHPGVELVPPMKLAALRYKSVLGDGWRELSGNAPAAQQDNQRKVVAVYNNSIKTIFLSESWTGANPVDVSVLVHEMVHHLQNLGKLKYECPEAREKLAYEAQDQWLKLYGCDLEKDFEIDRFTLVVSSICMS